jgi:hypothetical protein
MSESGVGRLLVASLHQGIADVLPDRLEFYEAWLSPVGLREGRIGLAPMAAVLSFLRQEGQEYHTVAARAGLYTADWSMQTLSPVRRRLMMGAPRWLRARLAMRLANDVVRSTYTESRVIVTTHRGARTVDIRGSIFCEVRQPVTAPLCGFYVAAIGQLLKGFALDVDVETTRCRATGQGPCVITITDRSAATPDRAPA